MKHSMLLIREAIEQSWCAGTSYSGKYDLSNPSAGQCAVTAMIVQDYFDGILKSGFVKVPGIGKPVRHYWNQIAGMDIDLTWSQFPLGSRVTKVKVVPRSQLKRSDSTNVRYNLLNLLTYNKLNGV